MKLSIHRLTADVLEPGPESYEARRADGTTLWKVHLDLGATHSSTFREEAVWTEAGLVAVGGNSTVVLVELATGVERCRLEVPSYFGHLSVDRVDGREWLFVLGWTDVHAFSPDLQQRWVSRDVAVDGITGGTVAGEVLQVHAEMDPPGGWFAVELDVRTGRELGRTPAFTAEYFGTLGDAGKT
jgi:hypothetical protein